MRFRAASTLLCVSLLSALALAGAFLPARARAAGSVKVVGGAIGGIAVPSGGAARLNPVHAGAAEVLSGAGTGSSGTSSGGTPPLLYGGGPVMHNVITQVNAWGPSGHAFPSGYVSGFEQYLNDLGVALGQSSNISSVSSEYVDATGPALSSLTNNAAISDTGAYPSSGCTVSGVSVCLTTSQILTELSNVISAGKLPVDMNHSYIVLLPPGVDNCFDSSGTQCEAQYFCGYHSNVDLGGSPTTYTVIPYTESSYSNAAGQCSAYNGPSSVSSDVMGLDSIGAHELFESVTDPVVGTGYTDSAGSEIGDKCAWDFGSSSPATGGGSYNQLMNGDQYMIQEMWSDRANTCVAGSATTATALINSGGSAVAGSATTFTATLSGDSASASSYQWSYADSFGSVTSNVATGQSAQLTFPSTGTYTVWVTVTDTNGGTVTGVTNVTVSGQAAPSASFTYTTPTTVPVPGGTVSFTSSATASNGSITGYSWNFGDGGSSTAADPSHVYAAAGTYTITLTVTQTGGGNTTVARWLMVDVPPTADFSWSGTAETGSPISFTSLATAGTGTLSSYYWSFGDGSTSTAVNPTHTYASAGTYTVMLSVVQSDGQSTTATHTITIQQPAGTGSSGGGSQGGSGTGTGTSTGSGTGSTGSTSTTSSSTSTSTSTPTGSSASSSSTSSGSTTAGGSSGGGLPAAARRWLNQTVAAAGSSANLKKLLTHHRLLTRLSATTTPGRLVITWYVQVGQHRVALARGASTVHSGVAAHLTIRLTAQGRALLRSSHPGRFLIGASFRMARARTGHSRTVTALRS